jgi:hypothetical protein
MAPRRYRKTAMPPIFASATVISKLPRARLPGEPASPLQRGQPSESPKGPVVNLAEEVDYDDAQARLADPARRDPGYAAPLGIVEMG